jgi:hypothetical protein
VTWKITNNFVWSEQKWIFPKEMYF